ncbi:hypothetical protein E2C01_021272 [Portunus trituberculatus]|uniref:Uncharacterized protein n=1 Tax=Portunus trituberculatus TaxID=210409 RepID=A0A5B7E2T8_PORTR|nr:hypothetical protein [Portunus trituberculatus]
MGYLPGDYPRDELYHYAAATYRVGNGTPPPPAPPSPPTHAHRPLSRGQKAFTALVYQAPSLHDVDCPNLQAEGEGRVPWPRVSPPHGPAGVADSQSEGYGSLMSPRGPSPPASGAPHQRHPAKHPRGPSSASTMFLLHTRIPRWVRLGHSCNKMQSVETWSFWPGDVASTVRVSNNLYLWATRSELVQELMPKIV